MPSAAEMADIERELEAVKNRVGQLERQRNDAIDALADATGLTRRQVLGIIGGGAGMGALGMLASQEARGAASTSDSDGDIGTPSSRADLFTDGINYAMATPSTAETVSEPIIAYDCSLSGFTITLDSSLEPSNGTQMVMLVDQTGNAGSNQVTVTATSNIDGGANITINHDHAVTILLYDGSEWRSTRFIDTVDARQGTFDAVTADDLVDGGGQSHTGRLTDLSELFFSSFDKTVSSGSVTIDTGTIQIREPGNASSVEESRAYSHAIPFDTDNDRFVEMQISNITIDNSSNADMMLALSATPDGDTPGADDRLVARVKGNGEIIANVSTGGSPASSSDTSQDNSYVSSLNRVRLSYNGSTLTVTTDDGSTEITVTQSTSYPSGKVLFAKIVARDSGVSSKQNVDFDVDDVVIGQ